MLKIFEKNPKEWQTKETEEKEEEEKRERKVNGSCCVYSVEHK